MIAHEGQYVLKCQFSLDARYLATCSSDKTCKVWELSEQVMVDNEEKEEEAKEDAEQQQEQEVFEEYVSYSVLSGHGGWVWDCDFTCDNSYLITVSTDQKVRIWRTGKDEIRKVL